MARGSCLMGRLALTGAVMLASELVAQGEVNWDDALVVGHTPGDKCFFRAGEEMVFTLELKGVKGEIPPGEFFLVWKRSANDGKVEQGRAEASLEKPLVICTKLDVPGFVKIEANLVDKSGKIIPKKHMWEKRVFFQGGAGVDVDKIPAWPEPKDFDAHWAADRKLIDALPLKVLERTPLPCANHMLNLWRMKLNTPDGILPATGYLVIPKAASASNRMKATGCLSGYYNFPERCPNWMTNGVDGIKMYINRHGCDVDQPAEYYQQFFKPCPYPPEHFRAMALRGMQMFRYLKTLVEWNGKDLVAQGSSGGAMQTFWMAMVEPGITKVEATAAANADIFGFKFGRATCNIGQRVEGLNYYDICNAAKRVKCPVVMHAGLGDSTCPPAGLSIVYRNLKCKKQITWSQGCTHGWWPTGMKKETWSSGPVEANRAGVEELTTGAEGPDAPDPLGMMLSPTGAVLRTLSTKVRLSGRVGESADRCIQARCYSDWARGPMYEEAINAFRTHWDDAEGRAGWQNEYWGKTMLCFAGAIEYTGDPGLRAWALEKAHTFIREFQKPNGYLSTYFREDFLRDHSESPDAKRHFCHNIWGRKYTFWALLELHRVTGDSQCLQAAEKMADHLIAQLDRLNLTLDRTGAWNGVSSMSILRPLNDLIRRTNKESYRILARSIVDAMAAERNDPGALIYNAFRKEPIASWYPEPGFWAKSYEIMSCLEGLVDYYRLTGDCRALDGARAFYRHIAEEEINPMRGAGYFDHFLTAKDRVNGMTELCDVVHWIRLNREFFLLTGETTYADALEEAFYNAFLSGVQRDGRWGAHIVRSHGTRHLSAPAQTGMYEHQCCPDNMMRTYFDFAGTVIRSEVDGALSIVLYSDAEAREGGTKVNVSGGYPWGENAVTIVLDNVKPRKVRFRVPQWSKSFTLNGKMVRSENGWAVVAAPAGQSAWQLVFDMSPRLLSYGADKEVLPTSPQPKKSDEDIGVYTVHFMEWKTPEMSGLSRTHGGISIMRGPLVLAKGRLVGTSREETLCSESIRGGGWKASLHPIPTMVETSGVPAAWKLKLVSPNGRSREVSVSDFASLSNVDDATNWFSLWF